VSEDEDVARLRAAHARTSRALEAALAEVTRERERADGLEARAALLLRRLEAARGSVSFRIGRAAKAAIDTRDPRALVSTFRGEDEVLEGFADEEVPGEAEPARWEVAEADDARPIAVLSGSRLDARSLTPHGWRAALDSHPPSVVLVTGDAIAPGTPWGDWGTPGGRDGAFLVGKLVAWCHARGIAIAYWDRDGTRPAPRLPFDFVFPR